MERLFAALALGLTLAAAVCSGARCDPEDDSVKSAIKDPDWLAEPSFEERAKAYPAAALKQGLGGQTVIHCKVKPEGRLIDCAVVSETPAGAGFGQASLALADRFRMKSDAAEAHAGGVNIPIRWAIVSHPDWQRQPSGSDLADLYPAAAVQTLRNGRAQIKCRVKADGTLSDCFIESESPAGAGFGAATLKATRYFRMKPLTLDGKPVDGGMVVIPINWLAPGGANPIYRMGDDAMLVTILKSGATRSEGKELVFSCPSATDTARKCQGHPLRWRARPSDADVWDIMIRDKVGDGQSTLNCAVADDGALSECLVKGKAGPGEEAAMRELAGALKAAPETADGVPTKQGRVLLHFNWSELRDIVRGAQRPH